MTARTSAFGATLRRFREAAGMSQEQLAERAGLSLRGVSDLERGERITPRLETVRLLAEALGLDGADRAALLSARSASRDPSLSDMSTSMLPTPSTSFLGREEEIGMISDLLATREARLVTLVGTGGVGKTRLSLEVGQRLVDAFPDGVVFAGLASIRDPELVLPSIASALGAPDAGSRKLLDLLAMTLRGRRVLLMLDNLEQVVEAAPQVTALLDRCPTVSILATSRVMLHVTPEKVVPVAPLALPQDTGLSPLTLQGSSEAVALFVDRARTSDPGFALTASNASVIATLVRRLDGLPLAIELAAARIRLMPPDALLARMDRQLPMLTGGGRDVPERQQTMRNAIGWSYHLLSPVEQAIFRRLSIFRAGCMLETAEKVLRFSGDLDDIAILDGLTALIDSSLLHRTMEEGMPPRLTMLATVREFGLEQLAEHGEEAAAREAAYRAWYIDLARKGEPWRGVETEVEDLDLLESEHDNLRSALDWLITEDRIQEAMDLAGALWFFRWLRGHYAETRDQLESLLQHPLGQVRTVARAKALTGIGVVAFHQGDTQRSGDVLDEAIGILREAGDQRYLAMALMCSGVTHFRTGRIDMAEAQTRESLAIASSLRWDAAVQGAMCNLGLIAELLGREEEARRLMDEHVALARSSHNVWGLALGLSNKGARSMRDGDLDRAEAYLKEAKVLFTALKDKRDLPVTYWTLADIARQRGDLEKASETMHQALNVAREIGDWPAYASCLTGLGWILNASGDTDVALRLIHEAAGIHREADDPIGMANCLDLVVEIAAKEGDASRAAWCQGVVDRILVEHGVARTDMSPHEHESRIRFLKQALGEPGWRRHWTAGHNHDVELALEMVFGWNLSQDDGLVVNGNQQRSAPNG